MKTFTKSGLHHLIKNKTVHSFTVLPLKQIKKTIEKIKKTAKAKGFLLGDGYSDLKSTTLRIANFPALKDSEVKGLMKFLSIR
jgi:phosphoserine aminotransferase